MRLPGVSWLFVKLEGEAVRLGALSPDALQALAREIERLWCDWRLRRDAAGPEERKILNLQLPVNLRAYPVICAWLDSVGIDSMCQPEIKKSAIAYFKAEYKALCIAEQTLQHHISYVNRNTRMPGSKRRKIAPRKKRRSKRR